MATKKKLLQATAKGEALAWDLGYFSYGTDDSAWDISGIRSGEYFQRFSVGGEEATPRGMFVNNEGTKLYVVGVSGDDVNEYTLTTPYDITSATFIQAKSVATELVNPYAIFFKPDGTKMYVGINDVAEYSLSTSWDVSTATHVDTTSFSSQGNVAGIYIKSDGTKAYMTSNQGDDVNEYDLDPAWDISTASLVNSFSVATEEATPYGVWFKDDGSVMYVGGLTSDNLNEYSLSTAWDISTASLVRSVGTLIDMTGIAFAGDGRYFYYLNTTGDYVYSINLGTFYVGTQELTPTGVAFKPDGSKMYIVGSSQDAIDEWDLSTSWDMTTATYSATFSLSAQDTTPYGIYFRPDGMKFYIVGDTGNTAEEYTMSTAWSVSTASHTSTQPISEESAPRDIHFKPDGSKMYIVGEAGDDVNEYDLSTSWDITSETFVQSFSVAAQSTNPSGLFFKDDGLKMYVLNRAGTRDILQYGLSTAWDVSTATFEKSIPAPLTTIYGLFFKPDGTMIFHVETARDKVVPYSIA